MQKTHPTYRRYAIYVLPEPGPLADFGARWLGRDVQAGRAVPHLATDLPLDALTATPRKYGFHGTIKPPFRLAEGTTPAMVTEAARRLFSGLPCVTLQGLAPQRIGSFMALTPTGDTTALSALAAEAVRGLDSFRAPATEAELARRRRAGLSPRQEELLLAWGYPYVLEEFRFHLTLTGRMDSETAARVEAALPPLLAPLPLAPFWIRDLCLCGEDEDGQFHLIERLPLKQPSGR